MQLVRRTVEKLRRSVALFLRKQRDRAITGAYRRAYANDKGRDPALKGWESEAVWPDD